MKMGSRFAAEPVVLFENDDTSDRSWIVPAAGASAATKLAAGFAALTGVRTFFGIKDGALDRLVGQAPHSSLLVFVFIGAGVLIAALTPALKPSDDPRVRIRAIVVVVIAMLVAVWVIVPNVAAAGQEPSFDSLKYKAFGSDHWWKTLLIVLCLAVAVWVAGRHRMTLIDGALVLSTAAISLGLYTAVKLSVESKTSPVSVRADAEIATADGARSLKLTVHAARLHDGSAVQVFPAGPDGHLGPMDSRPGCGR